MAETFFIRGVDSLVGVVPPEWLRKDRLVIDNSRVAVAIHHRPSVVGHCVVFPKVACARLEDVDPDVFCALGMMLPVVKRAVRIATGYRSCGIVLQSGSATGQACAHLYFEVVPSGKSNKNFEFKWDPHGDADAGRQRNVTKAQATAVLRAVRHKLGFLSPCEDWANVLYDTAKITAELVQEPSSVGHFVVSPKELSPDLEDCTREDVGACLWVVPKIAKAMCLTMRTQDFVVCLLNGPEAGQISPHLTFQVVPFSLRKVAVTFDAEAKVKMRDDQSLSLCNALRQVIGEDQLSTAMRMPVIPLESSWDRPPSRPSVSRAGRASPFVDRGRTPHVQMEGWAAARPLGDEAEEARANRRRATGMSGAGMTGISQVGVRGGRGGALVAGGQRILSSAGSVGSVGSAGGGEWSRRAARNDEVQHSIIHQVEAMLRD